MFLDFPLWSHHNYQVLRGLCHFIDSCCFEAFLRQLMRHNILLGRIASKCFSLSKKDCNSQHYKYADKNRKTTEEINGTKMFFGDPSV